MILYRVNAVLGIMLVVLTLAGLLIPAVRKIQEAAARTQTANHLKQMGLALHGFHDAHKQLPPAFDQTPGGIAYPVSVHVHLLPFIDQEKVYRTFLLEGEGNAAAIIPTFVSAMDGSITAESGVQNFAANLRVFSKKGWETPAGGDVPALAAVEPGSACTFQHMTRGTHNTITFAHKLAICGNGGSRYAADPTSPFAAFFGQNAAHAKAHYSNPRSIYQWAPRGNECLTSPLMAQSYLPSPIFVVLGDGSVKLFPGDWRVGWWNIMMRPVLDEWE